MLGAYGCALVVGVDFDNARLVEAHEGGSAEGCTLDQKECGGVCVSTTDPAYGCGSLDCAPCSLAHTTGSVCGAGGACKPAGCEVGFEDCDREPSNGCEADLGRKDTCGSCTNRCADDLLCAPSGCVSVCPTPLIPCSGSCVESLPRWYVDNDGDGFGTDVFVEVCEKPDGHAPSTGDCLDTNAAVHPDAAASDVPFDGSTGPSFDYDCSGAEVEEGNPVHFTVCAGGCAGQGAVPLTPARVGPGVNNYCGSPLQKMCRNLPFAGCRDLLFDAGTFIKCN